LAEEEQAMTRCPAGPEKCYGTVLRERRLAAGLTQRELAEAGQASVAAIRDLEQGRTRHPRPVLAGRLAQALRLDPHQAADLLCAGREPAPSWRPAKLGHASGLRLRILGPVAAWRDGAGLGLGGPRQRAVLGLLAAYRGAGLHREAVIDALWGERPPATAVSLVHAYVSRLRRALDPGRSPQDRRGVLVSAYARYALQATADQLDLLAFEELADRAGAAGSAGDPAAACGWYEQALGLWQAEPLADIEFLRHHPAVVGLALARAAVIARYADAAFSAGLPGRVLPHLRDLAWHDPLDEKAHAQLMIALAATGQQAAALRVYDGLRDRLERQLGVCPGDQLTRAHARVLHHDLPGASGRAATLAPREAGGHRAGESMAGQPPRQLPPPIAALAGRKQELDGLFRLLENAGPGAATVPVAAVCGTAGAGKTTLALHWAHQVADRFPGGQLYVNLRGFSYCGPPVPPARAVRGFLRALGVPAAGIPADPDGRAALYRSLLAGRRMLVVLDDASDAAQVRPLLPGSPGCFVLVTSRRQLTGLVAEGARPVTLDVLSQAEARELLARRLGRERTAGQAEALDELAGLCARLPLALSLAAAHAAVRPGVPLAGLAAELRDPRTRLDVLDGEDPATSLLAAFCSSYRALSGPAARMFRLLGLVPGPDISAPAAASLAGLSLPQAREALRELARGHLVSEQVPGRFACHDLLRGFAAGRAEACDGEAERRAALSRLSAHYAHCGRS
jgi:DNA-binding SARP family transcriptional activator